MKNILYLHAGAEMYGADKILLEIVTGIDKSKFHPIVILPSYGVLFDKMKSSNIDVYVIDYPILRRKYFNPRGIVKYIYSYGSKSKKILRFIKDKNIDIIHVNTTAVLEGIFLKLKLNNAKLIWHVHEIITNPRVVNLFLSFLIGKYSDVVITVSKAVEKNLLDTKLVSKEKMRVIYNGVDENHVHENDMDYLFEEFNVPKGTIKVGMIGRINSWKGQDDFIQAVIPILKSNRDVHSFIIGSAFSGEEWRVEHLKEVIAQSGVANQIHLCGFRTDVQNLFKFFDVFVLPSTKPDPLPTVVLEAMAAGKPIIGYNHGGIAEMVVQNQNGVLVPPNDVNKLSYAISNLISSESKIKKFGNFSVERQKAYYSKSAFLNNFNNLYKEI